MAICSTSPPRIAPDSNVEINAQASRGEMVVAYPLHNAIESDEKVAGTLGTGSS
jgi:hypothetical protein